MKNLKLITLAVAVNGALLASPQLALADTDAQHLEELDQKVKVLERKLEIQQEDAVAKTKETPVLTAGEDGFVLASRDKAFQLRLRGLVQVDDREFVSDKIPNGQDTLLLRRVRPIFEGTLYDKYDFRFVPDFGGGKTVIQDAYLEARFLPEIKVRAGKFTAPVGLERLQSDTAGKFVERGLPTNLVPNRDIGLQVAGDLYGGVLTYAAGLLNGSSDGRSSDDNASVDTDNNDDKDVVLRIFANPFQNGDNFALRGFGIGVGASQVNAGGLPTNTLLPAGYRSAGQQTFFTYRAATSGTTGTSTTFSDGDRNRLAPQLYYYYGPFGLLGEYTTVNQDVRRSKVGATAVTRRGEIEFKSWQLAASYVITGEDASFNKSVSPKTPFAIGTPGWGAFEIAARISELKVDDEAFSGGANSFAAPNASASKARETGVGVNWYLNKAVRASLDYIQTDYDGGAGTAAAVTDRPTEKVFLSRLQLAF